MEFQREHSRMLTHSAKYPKLSVKIEEGKYFSLLLGIWGGGELREEWDFPKEHVNMEVWNKYVETGPFIYWNKEFQIP